MGCDDGGRIICPFGPITICGRMAGFTAWGSIMPGVGDPRPVTSPLGDMLAFFMFGVPRSISFGFGDGLPAL